MTNWDLEIDIVNEAIEENKQLRHDYEVLRAENETLKAEVMRYRAALVDVVEGTEMSVEVDETKHMLRKVWRTGVDLMTQNNSAWETLCGKVYEYPSSNSVMPIAMTATFKNVTCEKCLKTDEIYHSVHRGEQQ